MDSLWKPYLPPFHRLVLYLVLLSVAIGLLPTTPSSTISPTTSTAWTALTVSTILTSPSVNPSTTLSLRTLPLKHPTATDLQSHHSILCRGGVDFSQPCECD
ncbi:hypothetical protein BC829DRAFT_197034 [Chytridium lagenaria]|nr:hypothetical protein BC829DRAFT_197034 [Chytridium lagenaria]